MARNQDFGTGTQDPNPYRIQVRPFTPMSVLDNITPSGIGYGQADKARLLPGNQQLPSSNGRSKKTGEQRQWLDQTVHVVK